MNNKLSYKTIYGYGLGEFGLTFFNSLIAYYLLFFLTDIIYLPIKLAAVIYAMVQWFEAISSLLCGVIVDKVHTSHGRYRPWLMIGSIICFIGTVVFFSRFDITTESTALIFTIFYLVAYLGYNFMWIAYRSLISIIGKNSLDTISLTISGTQLATVASLLFSYFGTKMLYAFQDEALGFTVSATVYCGIIVICMFIVSKIAKPFDLSRDLLENKKHEVPTIKQMLQSLVGPMIPFSLSFVLALAANTILFTLMVYYFIHVMNDKALMTFFIVEFTLVRFAATFFVKSIALRFDKRVICIVSRLVASVFLIFAYIFYTNKIVFFIFMGCYMFSLLPGGILFMPFISDITDYNLYVKKLKVRSFTYAASTSLIYIAQFVGAAVASFALVQIGYDPLVAAQAPDVITGIAYITILGTAFFTILSTIPMIFYKLDRKTMVLVYEKKNQEDFVEPDIQESI